jgi:hypothetical protein
MINIYEPYKVLAAGNCENLGLRVESVAGIAQKNQTKI